MGKVSFKVYGRGKRKKAFLDIFYSMSQSLKENKFFQWEPFLSNEAFL